MLLRGELPLLRWMRSVSKEWGEKNIPRAHAAVDTEPLAQVHGTKRHSVMRDIQGDLFDSDKPLIRPTSPVKKQSSPSKVFQFFPLYSVYLIMSNQSTPGHQIGPSLQKCLRSPNPIPVSPQY